MFGSNYDQIFGRPPFPFEGVDPQGGFFGSGAGGAELGGIAGLAQRNPTAAGAVATGLAGTPAAGPAGASALHGSGPDATGGSIGPSASPSVDALKTGSPLALGQGVADSIMGRLNLDPSVKQAVDSGFNRVGSALGGAFRSGA